MSCYAVHREAGPAWADDKGAFRQPGVEEHSAFMGSLAEEGFLLLAGPLAGSEHGRIRVLLIVDADSDSEVHRRLADDPWATAKRLQIKTIEPWSILVGEQRLSVGLPG